MKLFPKYIMKLFLKIILIFGVYYIAELIVSFFNLPFSGSSLGISLLVLWKCISLTVIWNRKEEDI